MLTPEQEAWIDHLSDEDTVSIVPYDPTAGDKFEAVARRVRVALGDQVKVEHRGSSSLRISGQHEIDAYIPVPASQFDEQVSRLSAALGSPTSLYPLQRARFKAYEGDTKIEVFIVNAESAGWLDHIRFDDYLKACPEALADYERLKQECNGISVREYYRRKLRFINHILSAQQQASSGLL